MKIFKNSVIYLGSSILSKMIPFLLLPIMTRYLTPQEYGVLSIYLLLIALYSAFIGMALQVNILKNFFNISKYDLSKYIGNIFIILSLTFSFYLFITYIITLIYDSVFSIPSKWLIVIPFISVMMMVNEINTTILRNEQRVYTFGMFEVSSTIVKMSFTVLFLITFSMSWYSQVLGTLLGSAIFFIVSVFYMNKNGYIYIHFEKEKINSILNISIPLIPHVLGGVLIAMSDRIFIEKMIGIDAVGIYSVGYMFGMVVILFTDAFIKAWTPWFYKSLSNPTDSAKQQIVKYTYIYIAGVFILALFVSILGELSLPYFVDTKFYKAKEYILWIALGYAVHGVYGIFFPYLVHLGKTSFLAFSTVIAALLNLVFNYIFIQHFGVIGAAYATIFSFIVSAGLVFWYQKKHFDMPWMLSK